MWIKLCAHTNLDDALAAAELGADAIGFVFAPSRRQVTAAQVAAITPHLPPGIETVGVFSETKSDADIESIAAAVQQANLTTVQLHGGLDLALAQRLTARLGPTISLIHATHWTIDNSGAASASEATVRADLADLAALPDSARILVDAKVGHSSGGLGVAFNWAQARPALTSQPTVRVIVAGGLTPQTVAHAIQELGPWGVDVASGVEVEPGKKSYERMKAFIKAARGATQGS